MDTSTSLHKRRKAKIILKQLRQHQQQVEDDKDDAIDCRSEALTQHFKKAEDNFGKAKTVDHALLDAQIFHQLGKYSKRQADQLQSGLQTYDGKTLGDKLSILMQRSRETDRDAPSSVDLAMNLMDMGKGIASRWRTVPSVDFMHGTAPHVQDTPVAEKKRAAKPKKGAVATKPVELKTEDVEQTETDREVKLMKKELQRRRQCNYWVFVIDPNSFPRSVENVFHSCFLIKDLHASLDLKREPPIIRYCDARERSAENSDRENGNQTVRNSQFIMGFDRNMWLEMVRKYNIRQCILKAKAPSNDDEQLRHLQQLEQDGQTAMF